MASPDVTPYVDLTIFDVDTQDLFDAAVARAQASFPEWIPVEGNVEVVLLEAMAELVSEMVFAINRLPDAVAEVLLRLFGATRSPGVFPTATVTFTVADAGGHTIPKGTLLALPSAFGGDPLIFSTDADLVILGGATTGTVAVTADTRTEVANGTAAGSALDVVSSVPAVDSAVLATAVSGGQEPESGIEFIRRTSAMLTRLTQALVLPDQFVAAAAEDPLVVRAFGLQNYDGTAGATAVGHMTVAVYGDGAPLSASAKQALRTRLLELSHAGLQVHVIDPTVTAVPVTVTVMRLPSFTDAAVQANVQAALDTYLDPATWPFAATVYRNELIALIDRVEGVDRVVTLSAPAADVALTGAAPLADLGAVTVTVQSP